MNRRVFLSMLVVTALGAVPLGHAQPKKPLHVGVVHEGGYYNTIVDALKIGHRDLGLEPG